MRAVYLESGKVVLRQVPRPECKKGFAVIRLLCGGICNTDLELQRGYYGFSGIPGHEFVGEVVESENPEWIGRRVVGEINLACRNCESCAKGRERHCPHRTVLGIVQHPGAFQEFFTLPQANLHAVPDAIPTEVAVFTEPLAAACEILDQVRIPRGESIAVLGDGKLGLLIALVLHASTREVHLFGRHPEKLAIAKAAGVITEVAGNPPAHAFDWVVDATGSPEGLPQAISMCRPLGTVVMKSTIHGSVALNTANVIVNELTLVGSRCGRFEPALRLLAEKRIDPSIMVADCFPLTEAPRAFERASEHGVLKVLLTTEPIPRQRRKPSGTSPQHRHPDAGSRP
jgi:threonine dehydrogenase-like Zn-dependent dehydrogenase